MAKKIIAKFECNCCGSITNSSRYFIIDEYLKKIELPRPNCVCGNKIRNKSKLIDISLEEDLKWKPAPVVIQRK